MGNILRIQFPEDFEERYEKYKALLGVEKKVSHEEKVLTSEELSSTQKYSEAKEPIKLKTLGVTIVGSIISRGEKRHKMNKVDTCLVYFFYYKSRHNRDECFKVDRIVSEIKHDVGEKAERYIKNRIVNINKAVRELLTKGKTNIRPLIKHENRRGYRFNPSFEDHKINHKIEQMR